MATDSAGSHRDRGRREVSYAPLANGNRAKSPADVERAHGDGASLPAAPDAAAADARAPAAVLACAGRDEPRRTLGTVQLVGMLFFMTSGAGYGLEPMVGAAGPLPTLIALLVAPWIWALPQALMSSELATMMPEDGGFILWVEAAFGPFWGFQLGWWSFVDALVDNALFPRLFSDYLLRLFPAFGGVLAWLLGVAVLVACTLVNVLGVDLVGWAAVAFSVLVASPFVIVCALGFAQTSPAVWLQSRRPADIDWSLFLASVFWNYCGYDSCSTLAGEIRDVRRTFPRAMMLVLLVTVAGFTLPIMAAVTVNNDWGEWTDAFWPAIADRLAGGRWLGILMCVGGLSSAAGMLNSLIATSSRAVFGMVRRRLLPERLGALHPRHGTPWVCILMVSAGTAGFTLLPFNVLVQMDSTLYCMKIAMEFMSLGQMRRSRPHHERPFRIGGGRVGVALVVGCGLACCTLMTVVSGLWPAVAALITAVLGLLARAVLKMYGIEGEPAPTAVAGEEDERHGGAGALDASDHEAGLKATAAAAAANPATRAAPTMNGGGAYRGDTPTPDGTAPPRSFTTPSRVQQRSGEEC